MSSQFKTIEQLRQELEQLQNRVCELENQLQANQNEQKFQALFNNSLDAMLIADDEGHYVEANAAACQMLGFSKEKLLTMRVVDIMPRTYKDAIEQNWKVFIRDGEQSGEFEYLRPDGERLQLEYKAKAAFSPGLHLSFLRDVTARKKVEESLSQSQKLYHTIAQNIPNGDVYLYDRDLRCILAEGTLMRSLGYAKEQIEGKLLQEAVRPEIYEVLGSAYRKTLDGEPSKIEYAARDRYFIVHFEPVKDEEGQIFAALALSQEITEPRRLQEQLRTLNEALETRVLERTAELQAALIEKEEAQHFSQAIAATLPDILYINDLVKQRNIYQNQNAAAVLGYTPAEIEEMGTNLFSTIMHPEDLAELPQHLTLLATLKDGEILEREYRCKDAKGEWHWFYSRDLIFSRTGTGQPKLVLGLSQDITLRKQTEARLREKEEQYRSIFEVTSEAMFIVEPQTNRIVEANPAASRMYGYSKEEFLELPSTTLLVHPAYHHLMDEVPPVVNSGEGFRAELINLRKDGSEFYNEVYTTPFSYQSRPHVLVVVRDITEQKQAYQLLEQRVEERTEELSNLLEVTKSLTSTFELNSLLELVLAQLGKLVTFTSASIATLNEAGRLEMMAYQGPATLNQLNTRFNQALEFRSVLELIQELLEKAQVVIIEDLSEESKLKKLFHDEAHLLQSFYEKFGYSRTMMIVPLVVKDQGVGLMTLLHDQPGYYTEHHANLAKAVANQAAIALENARLYQQAKNLAIMEERQRIARDLHDSVNQILYGIGLSGNTALSLLELNSLPDPRLIKNLEDVLELTEAGLDEMRSLIFELRPESLATEGLLVALTRQVMPLKSRYHLEADLQLPPQEPALSLKSKEGLYRITQEALHNVIKHAHAKRVDLKLKWEPDQILVLEIRDDGQGFDPTLSFPGHLGLRSMRERALQIGANLTIESSPGKGTHLTVKLPLAAQTL